MVVNTLCGETQTLTVYTMDGRMVIQPPVRQEATLNINGWAPGVYIIRVGSRTEKLIVR